METSTTHNPLIAYRPDIDGLRAIAVLSVIAFHIDKALLPGGFLGVDVFFVISGYLITLLLLKAIEKNGRLDLVDFYRRRIQRIFPALLLVLASTALAGYLIMAPKDYSNLMIAAFASVLSIANIYFHFSLSTDYFAPDTSDVPLLHVWSLGVEEQFYLLWPFVVLLLATRVSTSRTRLIFVLVGLALSLAAAHFVAAENQSFAYYMLPTRAWELLAGGAAALLASSGFSFRGRWHHLPGVAGLFLLAAGFFWLSEDNRVPGIDVVPVVLGASLLILSSPSSLAGRLLAMKPLVAIGLVSYSAYLWHWPILAFLRYGYVEITWQVGAGVFTTTLLLAAASYRFVELPFRRRRLSPRVVFRRFAVAPILLTFVLGFTVVQAVKREAPFLYDWETYRSVELRSRSAYTYENNCQYTAFESEEFSEARCVYPIDSEPSVLLIGDSNAAHYLGMLHIMADRYAFSLRNATQSACPALLDAKVSWVAREYAHACEQYRAVLSGEIDKYRTVVIGGSWPYYDALSSEFRPRFKATVEEMASRVQNVIILAKAPIFRGYNQFCDVRRVQLPYLDCESYFTRQSRPFKVNNFLQRIATRHDNVHFVDVSHVLCRENRCSPYLDGRPVYFDEGHISMNGSVEIGRRIVEEEDEVARHLRSLLAGSDAMKANARSRVSSPRAGGQNEQANAE